MGAESVNANESTASSLLERAKANDNEAWTRLVKLYSPLVYTRARLRGLDEEAAGDIVQDVMLIVSKSISRFNRQRGRGSFRGWLRRITENKITDLFRGEQGGPQAAGGTTAQVRLAGLVQDNHDEDVLPDDDERALLIRHALKSLEGEFEAHNLCAFYKMVVEGRTSREAAAECGGTPDGVRRSKSRIKKRLQELLADLLD